MITDEMPPPDTEVKVRVGKPRRSKSLVVAIGFGSSHISKHNIAIGEHAGIVALKKGCPVYKPWCIDIATNENRPEILHAPEEDDKQMPLHELARDVVEKAGKRGIKWIWIVGAPQRLAHYKKSLTAAVWKAGLSIEIKTCKITSRPAKFWAADPVPSKGYPHSKKRLDPRSMVSKIIPFFLLRLFA